MTIEELANKYDIHPNHPVLKRLQELEDFQGVWKSFFAGFQAGVDARFQALTERMEKLEFQRVDLTGLQYQINTRYGSQMGGTT